VYVNPVTGERAVIRIGTDTTGGERLVVDLYVQPDGAVMGSISTRDGGAIHGAARSGWVSDWGAVAIAEPGVELFTRRELLTTGGTPDRRKRSSEWRCGRLPGLRP